MPLDYSYAQERISMRSEHALSSACAVASGGTWRRQICLFCTKSSGEIPKGATEQNGGYLKSLADNPWWAGISAA